MIISDEINAITSKLLLICMKLFILELISANGSRAEICIALIVEGDRLIVPKQRRYVRTTAYADFRIAAMREYCLEIIRMARLLIGVKVKGKCAFIFISERRRRLMRKTSRSTCDILIEATRTHYVEKDRFDILNAAGTPEMSSR